VADSERHGKHGESEGQRNSGEPDAKPGVSGCENGCAATSKDQPERSEQLGYTAFE
jgi:hypothetical protein